MDFRGDFATHLTVRTLRRRGVTAVPLHEWAAAQGLELTRTVLDRGRTPAGPVLTRRSRGTFEEQRSAAERWAGLLAGAGFTVVRTRIEAAPWNEDVPRTDAEAAALPAQLHFEHRATVRLSIPYDTGRLAAVAERHHAHVARTARQVLPGGTQERCVIQRVRSAGRPSARARLDALIDALIADGFRPVDVSEEFVLHDDNPAVDSGWSEEPVEPAEPAEQSTAPEPPGDGRPG
ncbi:hypothetical protein [Streptomyces hebeiensis]